MASPLTIVNALLADGTTTSVRAVDGVVVALGVMPQAGDDVLDAAGSLVLPALSEPHAHLDKAYLCESIDNPTGDLLGAIEAMTAAAPNITAADTVRRAERAARAYAVNGTTLIRTHVDLTEETGLRSVLALIEVRERLADLVRIEVVALSGWPIGGLEGDHQRGLLRDAVAAGADVVGGCPHLDSAPEFAIDHFVSVAVDAGLPVDLHTDEHLDPTRSTLEHLARVATSAGPATRVTASHCVSLGLQPETEQRRIADLLAAAGVHVVTLPGTNLFLQGREHRQAMPRAITAVPALRAAGVNVAAGWDNLQDPFNPMGRADGLETASLAVIAAHLLPDAAYDAVSNAGRRLMGLPEAGPGVGQAADLVILPATTTRAAIAEAPAPRTVVRSGRLLVASG